MSGDSLCGNCNHPQSSHGVDRTPPCIDSDASPCFCMKFRGTGVKPPGETVTHATGAVRGSAKGRGRYDLISPIMMERLAKHLEAGAENYGPRNWEKGLPIGRMFESLFRHSWQAFTGQTDEDHLAAIICNAMFIMHTLTMIARGRLPESLDDRPYYGHPDEENLFAFAEAGAPRICRCGVHFGEPGHGFGGECRKPKGHSAPKKEESYAETIGNGDEA